MNKSTETNETRCIEIMLKIRTSLRAAVVDFFGAYFDSKGMVQRLKYSDGKVYEITIKEVRDEKR